MKCDFFVLSSAQISRERRGSRPGHLTGKDYSVQGNTMSSEKVWPAMARAFEQKTGDLVDRLLAALEAGQTAGGGICGAQKAANIIVRGIFPKQPGKKRIFYLTGENFPHPLQQPKRLVRLH